MNIEIRRWPVATTAAVVCLTSATVVNTCNSRPPAWASPRSQAAGPLGCVEAFGHASVVEVCFGLSHAARPVCVDSHWHGKKRGRAKASRRITLVIIAVVTRAAVGPRPHPTALGRWRGPEPRPAAFWAGQSGRSSASSAASKVLTWVQSCGRMRSASGSGSPPTNARNAAASILAPRVKSLSNS